MEMLCRKVRNIEERIWKEELQRGKHLAGYGGYLSLYESSAANDIGLPRPTEKDRMLLYDLDQYSRDLWGGKDVGYGGFKPQVESNITDGFMKNLDQTYNSKYRTTSGYTNMICQKERAKMKLRKPIVKQPFLGEIVTVSKGLKGFFQEGGTDPRIGTSEQGKAQAEKYFSVVRPMEGTLISINAGRSIKSRVMQ